MTSDDALLKKQKKRELLLQSKMYRMMGGAFALLGLLVFGIIYSGRAEGDISRIFTDPGMVIFIVFPFLPSIVLSIKAKKSEKELEDMMAEEGGKGAAAAQPAAEASPSEPPQNKAAG